ncbi:MAG: hypothetical protein ACI9FN_002140 [Saprospiraceae bacterium]|jgi:hypothetical protein
MNYPNIYAASMKYLIFIAPLLCMLSATSCSWKAPKAIAAEMASLPERIDFNHHVKPILSDKCFACHGPDKANQKAGLRLDIAEHAYETLKETGNRPIVKGNPGHSELIKRILSNDPEYQMPPPEFKVELSKNEIAILTKWVDQGAEYKPHWSFIRPVKSELPKVESQDWVHNEIDYFVAAKLESQNIAPSKKASKENLIRRVSFSLTGLPPTIEQIEAFVNDTSEDAYERVVDRLLASPAYGERMTADWMDVARYAESDGYLDDKHRDPSPYRDWVIDAFNENMSYDQFSTWQLAGDLIENPSKESILATAFNRLHKKNSEAGIVFEEYRVEYVADRTLTVGKAFLGLSVECARCHDHKYDPISQKDHYEMFAFFNSTDEMGTAVYGPGQEPGPTLLLTDDEREGVLKFIDQKVQNAKDELAQVEAPELNQINRWQGDSKVLESNLRASLKNGLIAEYDFDQINAGGKNTYSSPNLQNKRGLAVIKEPTIDRGETGKGIFINDYTTVSLPDKIGWFDQSDPFTISLSVFPEKEFEEAVLFTHCEDIRLGLKGYSLYLEDNKPKFIIARSWPSNAIQVKTKTPIPEKEWSNITVSYDGMGKAEGTHIYVNGKEVPIDIEIDNLYKSILFTPNIHTYGFRGFSLGVRDKMITFLDSGIDNLQIYERELSALEIIYSKNQKEFSKLFRNLNSDKNQKLLIEFYNKSIDPEAEKARLKVQITRKEKLDALEPVSEIMVLGDLPTPRPTFVLDRGMYDSPTEEVFPDVPEAVMPFDETLPRNRLGLSKWLFDKDHPLTARVFVNRIWQMHFGSGLVVTSDDFGNQGSLPSHPEILDWLAVEFIESGWDIKQIQKLIVMSATYQQSSEVRPALLEIDTDNRLLANGPSMRMSAEMVRDNALAISGLLSTKVGGPSVYPYQPDGLWDEITNKHWRYRYLQEPGEGLYRRSLYTIWKRTSGPPSMQIFDAGDRSVCTVNRRETSTPLQALVLLNDPQYIEASYVLAAHLIESTTGDTQEQLKKAFQIGTGREASSEELEILQKFMDEELDRFSSSEKDALAYLSTGETKIKSSSDPVSVAALSTVINGIMNTSEGYTIR